MGIIPKNVKKISLIKLLEIDVNDPDDLRYLLLHDVLIGLLRAMYEKDVSKNKLAKLMKISKQAVYEKFGGKNTSLEWIQRACDAIGVQMKVTFVNKKKAA